MSVALPPGLRWHLALTDLGFLAYWTLSALGAFPPEWLFKDHHDPLMVAWNWSFAPVDLLASMLGLAALAAARAGRRQWHQLALASACLTFCAGAMAIGFWALRHDFDPFWWLPNLYLMAWPLAYLHLWFGSVSGPGADRA